MSKTVLVKQMRVLSFPCPGCGVRLDGATSIGHAGAPEVGSVTVCIYCSTPLQFQAMGFIVMPDHILAEMTPDQREMFELARRVAKKWQLRHE